MNAQDLKNSILQRAIEGKLVPQRKEEGTAKELLAEIRAEKARLVKEKKIRKSKPLPEITDEEKPFDIPENWEWVRLGDILLKLTDGTHHSPISFPYAEYMYVTAKNIKEWGIDTSNITYVDECTHNAIYSRCNPEKSDILLIKDGATTGVVTINNLDVPFSLLSSVALLKQTRLVYAPFIVYMLRSNILYKSIRGEMKGTGITRITLKQISPIVIPLPPLAEQRRIAAKIEELQPDIDAYDKAQTKLQAIEQRFPDDMKKSLLQYAIEGKLVPQRKEEGTAKDLLAKIRAEKARLVKEKKIKKSKPLPAITDDEKPFDIPDSWEWARFGDISINMDSERIPLSVTQRRKLDKIYDYYGASGIIDKVDQYLFDRPLMLIGEDGANLLARTKPIAFIARGKYWVNNHAHVIDFPNGIDMKYMTFYMNAINLAAYVTGTAQPKMNQARMNSILIAIPPLAEQHRIVAKLEELLPLCQHLTANP
ncbi:restriction endonuclease subunit S [Mitsuokella multacida]|uniref:restriction endonuclease subunit S n=1 Tax=Mitsuokella multacida TaxID=52226 RepID=UPI0022E426B6|nr:restriction endonuclease subunit S [Mitsuokella multacida]